MEEGFKYERPDINTGTEFDKKPRHSLIAFLRNNSIHFRHNNPDRTNRGCGFKRRCRPKTLSAALRERRDEDCG